MNGSEKQKNLYTMVTNIIIGNIQLQKIKGVDRNDKIKFKRQNERKNIRI